MTKEELELFKSKGAPETWQLNATRDPWFAFSIKEIIATIDEGIDGRWIGD